MTSFLSEAGKDAYLSLKRMAARAAIEAFASDYGTKWPKAAAKVTDDAEALLCFFD